MSDNNCLPLKSILLFRILSYGFYFLFHLIFKNSIKPTAAIRLFLRDLRHWDKRPSYRQWPYWPGLLAFFSFCILLSTLGCLYGWMVGANPVVTHLFVQCDYQLAAIVARKLAELLWPLGFTSYLEIQFFVQVHLKICTMRKWPKAIWVCGTSRPQLKSVFVFIFKIWKK